MPVSVTQNKQSNGATFTKVVGSSRRLTITYVVFSVWVSLAIFAIIMDADLYALAVYFASGLPLILGYLWSETSRPSIKDAAEIVKGITRPNNNSGYQGYNSYGGNYGGGNYGNYNDNNVNNISLDTQNTQVIDKNIVSIYSDDATVELKINQSQLETFKNIGYVDMIGNKFTFKKNLLDQIKSLLSNDAKDPVI